MTGESYELALTSTSTWWLDDNFSFYDCTNFKRLIDVCDFQNYATRQNGIPHHFLPSLSPPYQRHAVFIHLFATDGRIDHKSLRPLYAPVSDFYHWPRLTGWPS
jgi:hypothetical protein